jgi:hypothetical protein
MTIPDFMEICWVREVKEGIKHTATQPHVFKWAGFTLNFYICLRKKIVRIWVPDDPKWTIHGSTQPHHANVETVPRLGQNSFIQNILSLRLIPYHSMYYSLPSWWSNINKNNSLCVHQVQDTQTYKHNTLEIIIKYFSCLILFYELLVWQCLENTCTVLSPNV